MTTMYLGKPVTFSTKPVVGNFAASRTKLPVDSLRGSFKKSSKFDQSVLADLENPDAELKLTEAFLEAAQEEADQIKRQLCFSRIFLVILACFVISGLVVTWQKGSICGIQTSVRPHVAFRSGSMAEFGLRHQCISRHALTIRSSSASDQPLPPPSSAKSSPAKLDPAHPPSSNSKPPKDAATPVSQQPLDKHHHNRQQQQQQQQQSGRQDDHRSLGTRESGSGRGSSDLPLVVKRRRLRVKRTQESSESVRHVNPGRTVRLRSKRALVNRPTTSASTSTSRRSLSRFNAEALAQEVVQCAREEGALPERLALLVGNSVSLNKLLTSLGRLHAPLQAVQVLRWAERQEGMQVNVQNYNNLIGILGRCKQRAAAHTVFKEMQFRGVPPDVVTYNTLIRMYERRGEWETGMRLLDDMGDLEPDSVTYNTLISAFVRGENWAGAEEMFQRMQKDSVQPDTVTFGTLIDGCGRRGDLRGAKQWFREMRAAGVDANTVTYNSLIATCAKVPGQWEEARRLFEGMAADDVYPDIVTYNSLISACAANGEWRVAQDLMTTMRAEGFVPDSITFNALITACANSGKGEKARGAFNEMVSLGLKPDAYSYTALISSCAETGDLTRAEEAFQQMRADGVPTNAVPYNAMLAVCGQAGDFEAAQRVMGQMKTAHIPMGTVTYGTLFGVCDQCDQWDFAAQLSNELKARGMQLDLNMCCALMSVCARGGEWEVVEVALQDFNTLIKKKRIRGGFTRETYNLVLNALWDARQFSQAVELLTDAHTQDVYANSSFTRMDDTDNPFAQDLHEMSPGAALTQTLIWISSLHVLFNQNHPPPSGMHTVKKCSIITGWGKHSKTQGNSKVKRAVIRMLDGLHSPFKVSSHNSGLLVAHIPDVRIWVVGMEESDKIEPSRRMIEILCDRLSSRDGPRISRHKLSESLSRKNVRRRLLAPGRSKRKLSSQKSRRNR